MYFHLVEERTVLQKKQHGNLAVWEVEPASICTAISSQATSDSFESTCFSKCDTDNLPRSSFCKNFVQSSILTPNCGSFPITKRLGSSGDE
jgi:hypothetical protein